MAQILVIDDDDIICEMLEVIIEKTGHHAFIAQSLNQGMRIISARPIDMVFLDVRLPDGNGIEAIPEIQETGSSPEVVIITGAADPDGAELAVRYGAWDYIKKPFSHKDVLPPIQRTLQYHKQKKTGASPDTLKLRGIIGSSPKMAKVYEVLAKAAAGDARVLITGETGTGKELFARAVHENSSRSRGPFVVVDCGALPETLAESTLFGHEKGAFTGAGTSRDGLFKEADKGTLFLDEIGELSLHIQKKLLRALQENAFRPVGARKDCRSSFRLIAATNRDLALMAEKALFRSDLLFRLRSVVIGLPPLRERNGDTEELAIHYVKAFCDRYGIGPKGISPDFLDVLGRYSWPGNVRELVHAIEHAVSMSRDEPTLFSIHLPVHIRTHMIREEVGQGVSGTHEKDGEPFNPDELSPLKEVLESTELSYMSALMRKAHGDIQKACDISGLSRSRLYARLSKYEIRNRRG